MELIRKMFDCGDRGTVFPAGRRSIFGFRENYTPPGQMPMQPQQWADFWKQPVDGF
jgi:hypothetical protein